MPIVSYANTLDNNATTDTLTGFYVSDKDKKMIYLREGNNKVIKINDVNFIEFKKENEFTLLKYESIQGNLHLFDIKPKNNYLDSDLVYKICKYIDFDNKYICQNSEYKHVLSEEKLGKKNYEMAMYKYLLRYGHYFKQVKEKLKLKIPPSTLANEISNTDSTSFSLVYKEYNVHESDYQAFIQSLWFLSFGDSPVNIYINGLDFRNGTPDKNKRHAMHKEDWMPYYKSNVFKKDFNIVYSWDSALGIRKKNTVQIENIIKFILKNNPNNQINLIAHSHGGNLAKEVLVNLEKDKVNLENMRLITLATPHKGIKKIDKKSQLVVPIVEVVYDMFSLNLKKHKQIIQASKRLYNGAYEQVIEYDKNTYLQKLNQNYVRLNLQEKTVFIAGKNDEIISLDSSLFRDVNGIKEVVNNSHGNIVDSPDPRIFKIIEDLRKEKFFNK